MACILTGIPSCRCRADSGKAVIVLPPLHACLLSDVEFILGVVLNQRNRFNILTDTHEHIHLKPFNC